MSTEERVRQAIATGEILRVIYNAGSQPGSLREISPISVKDGKVTARCFASNAVKSFVLTKMVVVEDDAQASAATWQVDLPRAVSYSTIGELLNSQKDFLVDLGWHIRFGKDEISLHRKFKTGKPLKGSDVSLNYEEQAYDLVADKDGNVKQANFRKRQRPWIVRGKNQPTKTYSHLDQASEVFLEWAKLLAPSIK